MMRYAKEVMPYHVLAPARELNPNPTHAQDRTTINTVNKEHLRFSVSIFVCDTHDEETPIQAVTLKQVSSFLRPMNDHDSDDGFNDS